MKTLRRLISCLLLSFSTLAANAANSEIIIRNAGDIEQQVSIFKNSGSCTETTETFTLKSDTSQAEAISNGLVSIGFKSHTNHGNEIFDGNMIITFKVDPKYRYDLYSRFAYTETQVALRKYLSSDPKKFMLPVKTVVRKLSRNGCVPLGAKSLRSITS